MPELTDQQAVFVVEYVRGGGRGAEAARKAGYSEKSAGKYAFQLLEKLHIQEAIHREQRRAFTELAAISLGQARLMLEDPKTPAGARVQLIMTLCDRADLGAVRHDARAADDGDGRPLREMSLAELEDLARGLRDKNEAAAA